MKIKTIEVILTWEDGTTNEVSSFLPAQTFNALEQFADHWEEINNEEDEEEEL